MIFHFFRFQHKWFRSSTEESQQHVFRKISLLEVWNDLSIVFFSFGEFQPEVNLYHHRRRRRRRRRLRRLRNELQPFKQLSEKQFRCL